MNEEELSQEQVRKRAALGVMSLFTRHGAVRLMAFAGTLVLARLIDPHTFGVFALAQFVLLLANAVAVGGITTALTRRRETVSPLEYKTAQAIQLAIALVIFAIVAAGTPLLAKVYDLSILEALAFPAMGAAVFLLASRSIPTAALQRALRHDLVAVSEVAEYVTYIVVSIGLALAGLGLWSLVIATLLRYGMATLLLYRMTRTLPAIALDRAIARAIVRETLPQQAAIMLGLAQRAINTTVVAAVFNPAAAGLVGMAITLLDALVLQPLALLANIQFRLMARVQDDPEKFRKVLGQSFFVSSVVCLPVLIVSITLFPMLVTILFPPSWRDTGYLVQALSLSSFAYLISIPSHQALKALGDAASLIVCYCLSAAAQLAILFLVGDQYGLIIFALANIVGNLILMIFGLVRLWVVTNRFPPLSAITGVVVAGGAGTAAGFSVAAVAPGLIGAVAGATLGSAVYLMALFMTSPKQMSTNLYLINEALPISLRRIRHATSTLATLADRIAERRWRES